MVRTIPPKNNGKKRTDKTASRNNAVKRIIAAAGNGNGNGDRPPVKSCLGRPSGYRKELDKLAYNYCLLGAIDKDLCKFFKIDEQTLNNWKKWHPTFFASIKNGKVDADANVANRLYTRAMGGYEYTETTYESMDNGKKKKGEPAPMKIRTVVKHCPPDVTAQIFWLKNRRPDLWRDRHHTELTGKDGGPIETSNKNMIDLAALSDRELRALERIVGKASADSSGNTD